MTEQCEEIEEYMRKWKIKVMERRHKRRQWNRTNGDWSEGQRDLRNTKRTTKTEKH